MSAYKNKTQMPRGELGEEEVAGSVSMLKNRLEWMLYNGLSVSYTASNASHTSESSPSRG